MTGAVLALMGSAASGGGGGGGSDLDITLSPDPAEWYYNGSTYTASLTPAITGGLAPYTVDWFVSGGDANVIFASNDALTVESLFGNDCEVYAQVTDANADEATSSTVTISLPA